MENEQAHSVIVYEDEVPRATSALAVTSEWLNDLELRVAGHFTAMTDDEHHANVDVGDSAQLLYKLQRKKVETAHIHRSHSRENQRRQNDREHRRSLAWRRFFLWRETLGCL